MRGAVPAQPICKRAPWLVVPTQQPSSRSVTPRPGVTIEGGARSRDESQGSASRRAGEVNRVRAAVFEQCGPLGLGFEARRWGWNVRDQLGWRASLEVVDVAVGGGATELLVELAIVGVVVSACDDDRGPYVSSPRIEAEVETVVGAHQHEPACYPCSSDDLGLEHRATAFAIAQLFVAVAMQKSPKPATAMARREP